MKRKSIVTGNLTKKLQLFYIQLFFLQIVGCTNSIELNAVDLVFEYADLYYADSPCDTIPIQICTEPKKERAKFSFTDFLRRGKATLSIWYVGVLNDSLRGFYRTTKRRGAATQFEERNAR